MLLSIVLFALNVLLIRAVALHTPSADGHVALVFRGAIGLMVVWVAFRGRGLEAGHLFRRPLVLARGAVGGVATLIFYLTITPLGAGRAVILNLTYPIFAAVMAALWIGEPIVRRQLGWMVVSFVGLVIFLGGKALKGGVTGYEYLGLAGAVSAGAAVVLIRLLRHSVLRRTDGWMGLGGSGGHPVGDVSGGVGGWRREEGVRRRNPEWVGGAHLETALAKECEGVGDSLNGPNGFSGYVLSATERRRSGMCAGGDGHGWLSPGVGRG